MKHTSRLFGEFEYKEANVLTFPAGLLGFPEARRYVLMNREDTAPVVWLLSVDEDGPEVALLDPAIVSPDYAFADIPLDAHMEHRLGMEKAAESALKTYAILTLPENVRHMSMNLRTPVLINPAAKRGMEYPAPGLERKPVRCRIYHELVSGRREDREGMLVMHRKLNQTVEIGDDISIQILEFANGGVSLGITAPKHVRVQRGEGAVTPKQETIRAATHMDVKHLEGVMKMHQIVTASEGTLKQTVLEFDQPNRAVG